MIITRVYRISITSARDRQRRAQPPPMYVFDDIFIFSSVFGCVMCIYLFYCVLRLASITLDNTRFYRSSEIGFSVWLLLCRKFRKITAANKS